MEEFNNLFKSRPVNVTHFYLESLKNVQLHDGGEYLRPEFRNLLIQKSIREEITAAYI